MMSTLNVKLHRVRGQWTASVEIEPARWVSGVTSRDQTEAILSAQHIAEAHSKMTTIKEQS